MKGIRCFFGWHKPKPCLVLPGDVRQCKRCGCTIMLDSQGNWFRLSMQRLRMELDEFKVGMEITENTPLKLCIIKDNVLFFKNNTRQISMHYNTFNEEVKEGELSIINGE